MSTLKVKIGGTWYDIPAIKGADGREVELQKGTTHIQWRYVGDVTWIDLVAIADLKGDDGRGISSIDLLTTVGLVKTYRITYTDNTTFDYSVSDGAKGADGLTTSVNGVVQVNGNVTLTKSDIGLGNVDNTSDLNKPISTATQTALDLKQTVFTGICQQQYLTENDIELDGVNLLFKINTVRNGTAISANNPICFYTDGSGVATKHILNTAQSISFDNITGVWYFYFDSNGTLTRSQTAWTNFDTIAAVFRMYWNATLTGQDRCVIQSVEYHKNDISWADHAWKHNEGTKHINGFDITRTTTTGTPAADGSNTCIALSSGTNVDDNLFYTITNAATPTAKFTQNLGTAATIAGGGKFLSTYNNTNGLFKIPATDFPFLWNPTDNIPQYVDSLGVRQNVTGNNFFVYYIYALQDPQVGEAIKIRSASTQFANATLAAAHSWETLQAESPTLRDNEIRVLYKLTFEYRTNYSNLVKYSALRTVDDLRKAKTTTTAIAAGTIPATSVTETSGYGNVQSAINDLKITQADDTSNSGTIAIAPNTIKRFTTALVSGNTMVISPTAPADVTTSKECMFIFSIGATLPTSLTINTSSVTFDYYGKAAPTLAINSKYTYVITWETTTLAHIRYDKKI